MNNQFKLTDNLTPRSIKSSYHYRLILIITFLLVALGAGYFSWRKIQLYLAQQLIHDCLEYHNCIDHIATLERLAKAKKNLKLFNLARANLEGINLKNSYLYGVNLGKANLSLANLENAYLYRANFYLANLDRANLENAYLIKSKNLTSSQIKSACYWEQALYKGYFSPDKLTWIIDKKANQHYIQKLQEDQASNPQKPVNCSRWK